MRKAVRVIIISSVILFLMVVQTFMAFAASSTIYVTADKTEAASGDTVNFTVSLGPVSNLGTMQMVLDISEGLTYVKGSGRLADGLKSKLGYDYADFTEVSLMVNGMASAADYSSKSDTVLCTFSCTVDDAFKGKAEVGLTNLEFISCETWEDHTADYSVSEAVITIGMDAGQDASSSDSGKQSGSGKSSDSDSSSDSGGSSSPDDSAAPGSSSDSQSQAETTSDDPNELADGEAGGDAADRAETAQSSIAVWLIVAVAVLLIATIIIVLFRIKKRK